MILVYLYIRLAQIISRHSRLEVYVGPSRGENKTNIHKPNVLTLNATSLVLENELPHPEIRLDYRSFIVDISKQQKLHHKPYGAVEIEMGWQWTSPSMNSEHTPTNITRVRRYQ